ncbi:MAG: homoserine kinase [Verrucomicrobiota bacterium]
MKKSLKSITIKVPATSANLGPGFDSLGVALSLYNRITVTQTEATESFGMLKEAASLFFKTAQVKAFHYGIKIVGDVPMSRGLGSSVTVRLGFLAGLNHLAGLPLNEEEILDLVIQLEGHPDNAVPAFFGGFACASKQGWLYQPIKSSLKFVTFIPEMELETKKARAVLPKKVSLADAVTNLQNTAIITAAFCTQNYELLQGSFKDTLHQPYRAKLLPSLQPMIESAEKAGALGGFLSGAGSTMIALALEETQRVVSAMKKTANQYKVPGQILVLQADNTGYQVLK